MKISVRLKRVTTDYGVGFQTSHDFRMKVPKYAQQGQENRIVVVKGGTQKEAKEKIQKFFSESKKKNTNSKAARMWAGIITFSTEAHAVFSHLPEPQRVEYYRKAIQKIEEYTQAEVFYAVEHLDETSHHLHFALCPKNREGNALSKSCFRLKNSFSKLQDIVATAFSDLGFTRGTKKEELIAELGHVHRDNKSGTVAELKKNIEIETLLLKKQAQAMLETFKFLKEKQENLIQNIQTQDPRQKNYEQVLTDYVKTQIAHTKKKIL